MVVSLCANNKPMESTLSRWSNNWPALRLVLMKQLTRIENSTPKNTINVVDDTDIIRALEFVRQKIIETSGKKNDPSSSGRLTSIKG